PQPPTRARRARRGRTTGRARRPRMAPPRLHLDADTSMKALHLAVVARGHDVTRTPTAWMARDASDTAQLLGATAQGRILFTFNTHDFPVLAQQYPQHGGL